jgi:hypothetical protein
MHRIGWAIAWEFFGRERYVMVPSFVYLAALVALINAAPTGAIEPTIAGQLALPLGFVIPYLIAIFSHGQQADVLARESGYPRRAFTLPLRTTALVGWPLAIGAIAVAGFWLVMGGLVLRSAGVPVPVLWPAVYAAGLLACTQALTWSPFPLAVLRVLVMVPLLTALSAAAGLAIAYDVPAMLMLPASAALVPLGYMAAVAGVARARRGDTPVRHWPLLERRSPGPAPPQPFSSSAAALTWVEWRQNLFLLPLMAFLSLVPLALLLFFVDNMELVPMLPGVVAYPLMMTFAAGASLGSCLNWNRQVAAMPAFHAVRPVTNRTILAVKFRAALVATLCVWVPIAVALAVTLPFSRTGTLLVDAVRWLYETQGAARGTAWLLLVALGLPALSWKWVVDQLCVGLCGRYWINLAAVIGIPSAICGVALILTYAQRSPSFREGLLSALPWLIVSALALKLLAGAVLARRLLRRKLIARRTLAQFTTCAALVAAALFGLASWLVSPNLGSPLIAGCAAVLLALPMVRLGLAPLALDWNRHR